MSKSTATYTTNKQVPSCQSSEGRLQYIVFGSTEVLNDAPYASARAVYVGLSNASIGIDKRHLLYGQRALGKW